MATAKSSVDIDLGADLTIGQAQWLHEHLSPGVDEPEAVTLDIGAVKRCDTAGVQLVLAFVCSRRAESRQTVLRGESEAWARAVGSLGVDREFRPSR